MKNRTDIPSYNEVTASGYCASCNTEHVLTAGTAAEHCLALMDRLRTEKRIDFDLPAELSDPRCSTDILYTRLGQMFGVLVCRDSSGAEVVLKAFSYKHGSLVWSVPGWVPTLADPDQYDAVVEFGNSLIHPLTAQIESMAKDNPAREPLCAERRLHSHRIMKDLYNLYTVRNFRGEQALLQDVFVSDQQGMPMGTGDCCAPKLLNYAAANGLEPVGIAEFYWGKPSHDGLRNEGVFYPACTRRCRPILGFMLCGAEK